MEAKIATLQGALAMPELQGRTGVLKLIYNGEAGEWEVHHQAWPQQ